jgi:hypothetical protein
VLLVDNKRKTSWVRSFSPLEVQVHSRNRHDAPWQRSMQVFIKSATLRSPLQATLLFRRGAPACAVERVFFVLLAFCCSPPFTTNAQTNPSTGTVRGTLFLLGSDGPAYVPGGTVVLTGLETQKTETDQEGRYSFEAVPPGTYRIEAVVPGLRAEQTITVEADKTTDTDLELKPTEVKGTVTVTANVTEAKVPAPSETISEQTLRAAPNVNERFESALPMIPGVVRGPDGHINMKGARSTQSGALVNSANVTDPVTGSPAMNLPVDVVSSVQVISNPYDPQYGKLTVIPVYDLHSGFPYSVENVLREHVGPRNVRRFPRSNSLDLQVSRPVSLRVGHRRVRARVGAGGFNLFNHFNPRDVQNNPASVQFGEFFNSAWREYRGKFVLEYCT